VEPFGAKDSVKVFVDKEVVKAFMAK